MQYETEGRKQPDDNVRDDEEDVRDEDAPMAEDPGDTVVLSEADYSDNVGDISVEINVEELVAKVEAADESDTKRKKDIRRRLEELDEAKNFEDTYAIEFDKD